jgi:hypothetical protein
LDLEKTPGLNAATANWAGRAHPLIAMARLRLRRSNELRGARGRLRSGGKMAIYNSNVVFIALLSEFIALLSESNRVTEKYTQPIEKTRPRPELTPPDLAK